MVLTRSMSVPSGLTRSYPAWLESEGASIGFMPLVDLFNHHSEPSVSVNLTRKHIWDSTVEMNENERLVIAVVAKEQIEKGAEVFLNYGNHSDMTLFTKYGFVSECGTNPFTDVKLEKEGCLTVAASVVGGYADWDDRNIVTIIIKQKT